MLQSIIRGESLLSSCAALCIELIGRPRGEWSLAASEWRAYWRDEEAPVNSTRTQHRLAGFGWILILVAMMALTAIAVPLADSVLGVDVQSTGGFWNAIYVAAVTAVLLLGYHWLLSLVAPNKPPGIVGRWSISWAVEAFFVTTACLLVHWS